MNPENFFTSNLYDKVVYRGVSLIPCPYLTITEPVLIKKTFKERWLSQPWQPWHKYKTILKICPSNEIIKFDKTYICHPDMIAKIKAEIDVEEQIKKAKI